MEESSATTHLCRRATSNVAVLVVAASNVSSATAPSSAANDGCCGHGKVTADAPPLEEKGAVSASYVSRVIGKGGR